MRFTAILLAAALFMAGPAAAKSVALVIGNDAYENAPPLLKAVADARAYREHLETERGFSVIYAENADEDAMAAAIGQFLAALAPGDSAMVVFSGHGVQLDPNRQDTLFLLPTDVPTLSPEDPGAPFVLSRSAIQFSALRDEVAARGAGMRVFVLDACRDNPFPTSGTKSLGLTRGLARVSATPGEFIFYAAAPGARALDRLSDADPHPNSVFSRVFLEQFRPGVYLEDLANSVQAEVFALAKTAAIPFEQRPYYDDGVIGKACLDAQCGGAGGQTGGGESGPSLAERLAYRTAVADAEAQGSAAPLRDFLARFPESAFADDVRALAGQLDARAERIAAATTPSPTSTPSPTTTPAPAPAPAAPEALKECDVCPEMVNVPGGTFTMGSPETEPGRSDHEGPQQQVTIQPFALGRDAVTVAEYRRFVAATGHQDRGCYVTKGLKEFQIDWFEGADWSSPNFNQGDDHPVVCVSHEDAETYVAWLNGQPGVEGAPYRLPSEAEQEYVLRADRGVAPYPWGADPDAGCGVANGRDQSFKRRYASLGSVSTCDDGYAHTAPVSAFPPNGFGVRQLSGNVWEWSADCGNDALDASLRDGSARMSGNCSEAVLRGGSWYRTPMGLRSASRFRAARSFRVNMFGFRLARTAVD